MNSISNFVANYMILRILSAIHTKTLQERIVSTIPQIIQKHCMLQERILSTIPQIINATGDSTSYGSIESKVNVIFRSVA